MTLEWAGSSRRQPIIEFQDGPFAGEWRMGDPVTVRACLVCGGVEPGTFISSEFQKNGHKIGCVFLDINPSKPKAEQSPEPQPPPKA